MYLYSAHLGAVRCTFRCCSTRNPATRARPTSFPRHRPSPWQSHGLVAKHAREPWLDCSPVRLGPTRCDIAMPAIRCPACDRRRRSSLTRPLNAQRAIVQAQQPPAGPPAGSPDAACGRMNATTSSAPARAKTWPCLERRMHCHHGRRIMLSELLNERYDPRGEGLGPRQPAPRRSSRQPLARPPVQLQTGASGPRQATWRDDARQQLGLTQKSLAVNNST